MSTKLPATLTILLNGGDQPYTRNFTTIETLKSFIKKEVARWNDFTDRVNSISPRINHIQEIITRITNIAIDCNKAVNIYRKNVEDDPSKTSEYFEQLRVALEPLSSIDYLYSKSNQGKFVLNKDDVRLASSTLYAFKASRINFSNQDISANANIIIPGIVNAELYNKNLTDTATSESETLTEVRTEYESLNTQLYSRNDECKYLYDKWIVKLSTLLTSHADDFGCNLDSYQKQMDDLITLYENDLGLRAPVTYWKSKQRSHAIMATVYGVFFTLMIAIGITYDRITFILRCTELEA